MALRGHLRDQWKAATMDSWPQCAGGHNVQVFISFSICNHHSEHLCWLYDVCYSVAQTEHFVKTLWYIFRLCDIQNIFLPLGFLIMIVVCFNLKVMLFGWIHILLPERYSTWVNLRIYNHMYMYMYHHHHSHHPHRYWKSKNQNQWNKKRVCTYMYSADYQRPLVVTSERCSYTLWSYS